MNGGHERFDDERLTRLLATRTASADPATLRRALARLAAVERDPRWLVWLTRPATVATAAMLLVVSVGAGIWYGGGLSTGATTAMTGSGTGSSDLLGSLLADTPDAATGGVRDTGGVR